MDLVLECQRSLDRGRQFLDRPDEVADRPRVEGSPPLREIQAEQLQHHELGGERLGGGDPDLWSRPRVQDGICVSGQGGVDDVGQPDDGGTLVLGVADRCQRVDRLTGLADPDDE